MPLTSHKSHVGIYEDFNYPMCTEEEELLSRQIFVYLPCGTWIVLNWLYFVKTHQTKLKSSSGAHQASGINTQMGFTAAEKDDCRQSDNMLFIAVNGGQFNNTSHSPTPKVSKCLWVAAVVMLCREEIPNKNIQSPLQILFWQIHFNYHVLHTSYSYCLSPAFLSRAYLSCVLSFHFFQSIPLKDSSSSRFGPSIFIPIL